MSMKRWMSIIATALLLLPLANSCVVESTDYDETLATKEAYHIFSYWRYGLRYGEMRFANVAFNFNVWLAASENERLAVASLYFPHYTIQCTDEVNGKWMLSRNGQEAYEIVTNNRFLSEPGAEWTMRSFLQGYEPGNSMVDGVPYTGHTSFDSPVTPAIVACTAPGRWRVDVDPVEEGYLGSPRYLSLTLYTPDQSVIRNLRDGGYYVEGRGYIDFQKNQYYDEYATESQFVTMFFQVEEPLFCDGWDVWNDGKLNIVVNGGRGRDGNPLPEQTVQAQFLPDGDIQHRKVRLSFYNHVADWPYGGVRAVVDVQR